MITKEQIDKIEELSAPLVKFINDNFNPYHKITITYDGVEIHSGECNIPILDYID